MSHLFQYSHALIFEQKKYDGHFSVEELKKMGDIGLGTFNGLNGELAMIEGKCYQCIQEQKVELAPNQTRIPWAAVTRFTKESVICSLEKISDFSALETYLCQLTDMQNFPYVFHIRAHFKYLSFRQVIKQTKPYTLSLEDVYKISPLEKAESIEADLVGFYMPDFMESMHPKGLHFHGVTTNQQLGGHVVDFEFDTAALTFEKITEIEVILS
ncbi:MAG: acetolactate decarboxylase [Legionellaceae bacterium]|nr:acetolactate decarboxylase [Legionellaceae bacterium]